MEMTSRSQETVRLFVSTRDADCRRFAVCVHGGDSIGDVRETLLRALKSLPDFPQDLNITSIEYEYEGDDYVLTDLLRVRDIFGAETAKLKVKVGVCQGDRAALPVSQSSGGQNRKVSDKPVPASPAKADLKASDGKDKPFLQNEFAEDAEVIKSSEPSDVRVLPEHAPGVKIHETGEHAADAEELREAHGALAENSMDLDALHTAGRETHMDEPATIPVVSPSFQSMDAMMGSPAVELSDVLNASPHREGQCMAAALATQDVDENVTEISRPGLGGENRREPVLKGPLLVAGQQSKGGNAVRSSPRRRQQRANVVSASVNEGDNVTEDPEVVADGSLSGPVLDVPQQQDSGQQGKDGNVVRFSPRWQRQRGTVVSARPNEAGNSTQVSISREPIVDTPQQQDAGQQGRGGVVVPASVHRQGQHGADETSSADGDDDVMEIPPPGVQRESAREIVLEGPLQSNAGQQGNDANGQQEERERFESHDLRHRENGDHQTAVAVDQSEAVLGTQETNESCETASEPYTRPSRSRHGSRRHGENGGSGKDSLSTRKKSHKRATSQVQSGMKEGADGVEIGNDVETGGVKGSRVEANGVVIGKSVEANGVEDASRVVLNSAEVGNRVGANGVEGDSRVEANDVERDSRVEANGIEGDNRVEANGVEGDSRVEPNGVEGDSRVEANGAKTGDRVDPAAEGSPVMPDLGTSSQVTAIKNSGRARAKRKANRNRDEYLPVDENEGPPAPVPDEAVSVADHDKEPNDLSSPPNRSGDERQPEEVLIREPSIGGREPVAERKTGGRTETRPSKRRRKLVKATRGEAEQGSQQEVRGQGETIANGVEEPGSHSSPQNPDGQGVEGSNRDEDSNPQEANVHAATGSQGAAVICPERVRTAFHAIVGEGPRSSPRKKLEKLTKHVAPRTGTSILEPHENPETEQVEGQLPSGNQTRSSSRKARTGEGAATATVAQSDEPIVLSSHGAILEVKKKKKRASGKRKKKEPSKSKETENGNKALDDELTDADYDPATPNDERSTPGTTRKRREREKSDRKAAAESDHARVPCRFKNLGCQRDYQYKTSAYYLHCKSCVHRGDCPSP